MGTWLKGSGIGVVALTLGLFSCGGKYEVGTGDTGGRAGEGGAGDDGSGGSMPSGQGGSGKSGAGTTGGRGGAGGMPSGGVAGVSGGGVSGSVPTGGTSGTTVCGLPAEELADVTMATPDVVWDRLSAFLHKNVRLPFDPPPDETTHAWVRERVRAILEEQYVEDDHRAPTGLEDFIQVWAFEGGGAESAQFWAVPFARPAGNFIELFATVDGRVSFMSDRAFLTAHPYLAGRGNWMSWNLACLEVPGKGIETPAQVPPNMTRREVVEASTSRPECAGCHYFVNPLGFSLEHYDELGDYRTTENGLPIDSSGTYEGNDNNINVTFDSIDDLAPALAGYCEVELCFARRLFEYALAQARPDEMISYEGREMAYVLREFQGNFLALGPLLEAIATTPAFLSE